jgi:hypothetical protein
MTDWFKTLCLANPYLSPLLGSRRQRTDLELRGPFQSNLLTGYNYLLINKLTLCTKNKLIRKDFVSPPATLTFVHSHLSAIGVKDLSGFADSFKKTC